MTASNLRQAKKLLAKTSGGSPSGRGSQAALAQNSTAPSGSAGQKMGGQNASAAGSAGHMSELSKDQEEQSEGGGASNDKATGSTYSKDFADSTKGSAMVSPPDLGAHPVFAFEPEITTELPDLANYEFLILTLDVRPQTAAGSQKKLDLYQRIEERLREYRAAVKNNASTNGLERPKPRTGLSTQTLDNKIGLSDGLEKKSTPLDFNLP
jgi:hypothetical protein